MTAAVSESSHSIRRLSLFVVMGVLVVVLLRAFEYAALAWSEPLKGDQVQWVPWGFGVAQVLILLVVLVGCVLLYVQAKRLA